MHTAIQQYLTDKNIKCRMGPPEPRDDHGTTYTTLYIQAGSTDDYAQEDDSMRVFIASLDAWLAGRKKIVWRVEPYFVDGIDAVRCRLTAYE